ncbi:MAG: hypothetical protein U0441_35400 [Polyangiaceae bacterium]
MDLGVFVERYRGKTPPNLSSDEGFKRAIVPRRIIAAAHASRLVFNRPYVDSRNTEFAQQHQSAWEEIIVNLTRWEESAVVLSLPREQRVLVTAWHFPEVPMIFAAVKQARMLALVSQDAPWFSSLRESGCSLSATSSGAAQSLTEEMSSGRNVVTILDHYWHPDVRTEEVRLLGQAVHTPSEVLDLASRFNYLLAFIAPRGNRIEVVEQMDATGRAPRDLAQQYNSWLDVEVKRAPDRWLMWQELRPLKAMKHIDGVERP